MASNPRAALRVLSALAACLAVLGLAAGRANAGFQVGLQDSGFGAPPGSASAALAAATLRQVDGSVVRVGADWAQIVGNTATVPDGFNPSDPGDPHYDWTSVDAAVRSASGLHARVLLSLWRAPRWAEGPNRPTNAELATPGVWDPSPADFAAFARAAAIRYDGHYPDPLHPGSSLPRVPYWEIWNEENLPIYLEAPDLVSEYRSLLNAGYRAIKAVNRGNVVVVGGLAPVSYLPPYSIGPLDFAAKLLCLHRAGTRFRANSSCPRRAEFDVLGMHPYSLAASPTKHAYSYGDVLVGDMRSKLQSLIAACDRLGTASPRIHHRLWVTEWAWFTNPPNALVGDPDRRAARFVAYSLYEMWRAGVSLVIWQNIRDSPAFAVSGGGLYTQSGTPKLMLSAYAFPFVAGVSGRSGFAWGRTASSGRRKVRVQRLNGTRWHTVATTTTSADGVFEVGFPAHGNGLYRARVVGGPTSLLYDSHPIPPRRTHLLNTG